MRLLIVEDDRRTGDYLRQGLAEAGFTVMLARNGLDGHHLAVSETFDLVIMDVMLPDVDGWRVVRALRDAGKQVPVLFLTARDRVEDRVKGLELGGDDYLVKPFAFGELSARVNALARRPRATSEETILRAGDLEMDLVRRKVTRAGKEIDLLPREFALLEQLLRRKGRVQTRTMLLESVWDLRFDPQTNVVETHISRLRAKVDKPFDKELIKTVRGAGYKIED